jgi:hypothetical protein
MTVLSIPHLRQGSLDDVHCRVEVCLKLVFDKRTCAARLAELLDCTDERYAVLATVSVCLTKKRIPSLLQFRRISILPNA